MKNFFCHIFILLSNLFGLYVIFCTLSEVAPFPLCIFCFVFYLEHKLLNGYQSQARMLSQHIYLQPIKCKILYPSEEKTLESDLDLEQSLGIFQMQAKKTVASICQLLQNTGKLTWGTGSISNSLQKCTLRYCVEEVQV